MPKPVICIGAALVDELFHATSEMLLATTNDATVTKTAGGVSRNIAQQLALLGVPVQLISVVGNDSDGNWLKQVCLDAGVKLDAMITKEGLTGKYTGIRNTCQVTVICWLPLPIYWPMPISVWIRPNGCSVSVNKMEFP